MFESFDTIDGKEVAKPNEPTAEEKKVHVPFFLDLITSLYLFKGEGKGGAKRREF